MKRCVAHLILVALALVLPSWRMDLQDRHWPSSVQYLPSLQHCAEQVGVSEVLGMNPCRHLPVKPHRRTVSATVQKRVPPGRDSVFCAELYQGICTPSALYYLVGTKIGNGEDSHHTCYHSSS